MTTATATTSATAPAPALPGITPHLVVRDATAAIALYQRALGAKVHMTVPAEDGKRLMHAMIEINGAPLMLMDAFPERGHQLQAPASFILHLEVRDADAWWKRAVDAGFEIVLPLELQFWGDRYGQLRDPFGVLWSIATPSR